jgi:type IV fimbrial biogenesis protein FimT
MRYRGFSLIELMTVLAIAVVLLAVGAPSLVELARSQHIRHAATALLDDIAMARSQAMTRGDVVVIMAGGPDGKDWTRGWTVFIDRDGDRRPGPADEIIAVHGPLHRNISTAYGFTTSAPPYYIAYNGAGRSCSDTNTAASRLGTLSLFDGPLVRRIKINMLGRPRACDPARDSSCDGPAAPP